MTDYNAPWPKDTWPEGTTLTNIRMRLEAENPTLSYYGVDESYVRPTDPEQFDPRIHEELEEGTEIPW